MMSYTLIIVALPAIMFLVLGLLGSKMKPAVAGLLGTIALTVMAALSYTAAYQYFFEIGKVDGVFKAFNAFNVHWLTFTDKLSIDLGIMLDPISVLMLVVVTTVSLMVHLYSL